MKIAVDVKNATHVPIVANVTAAPVVEIAPAVRALEIVRTVQPCWDAKSPIIASLAFSASDVPSVPVVIDVKIVRIA
jgi:hypothetical protein